MIQKLSLDEKADFQKVLLYGQSGVGKTFTSCVSEDKKVLLVDLEKGDTTLKSYFKKTKKTNMPDVYSVSTLTEFNKIFTEFKSTVCGYDYVVIDTLSELQNRVIQFYVEKDKVQTPTQQIWGLALEHIRSYLVKFRDLPVNLIVTCHEAKNLENGVTVATPALKGSIVTEYSRYFDHVLRLINNVNSKGVVQRAISVGISDVWHTKTRVYEPDEKFISASLDSLVKHMKG